MLVNITVGKTSHASTFIVPCISQIIFQQCFFVWFVFVNLVKLKTRPLAPIVSYKGYMSQTIQRELFNGLETSFVFALSNPKKILKKDVLITHFEGICYSI
jgi:hypothetical protein